MTQVVYDRQWVVEHDSAHAALLAQGYTATAYHKTVRRVRWVLLQKLISLDTLVPQGNGPEPEGV
jgi:hypothetical protein